MTLILNNDDVRRVLTMDACLEILEDAVGYVIHKRAKEEGIGREIPTEWLTQEFHT
jgi:hypothetical protein